MLTLFQLLYKNVIIAKMYLAVLCFNKVKLEREKKERERERKKENEERGKGGSRKMCCSQRLKAHLKSLV